MLDGYFSCLTGGCFVAGPVSEAAARLLLPDVCARCVHFTCIATRESVSK